MADSRQMYAEDHATVQANGRHQSLWSAVAPPVAWWWLVIAGASALFLGLGLLQIVQSFARLLGLLILGLAIATALAPMVRWLNHWLPRMLAVLIVYLLLLLFFVAIGWFVLPQFLTQAQSFEGSLPQQVERVRQWLNERLPFELNQLIDPLVAQLNQIGGQLLSLPITVASTVVDLLLDVTVVFFISIYALIASPNLQNFVFSLFPESRRGRVEQLLHDIGRAMGGYVRGVFLSALIIGVLTYVGLLVLGVNYAAVLGVTAGLLEIIPIFGPLLGGIVIVLVALLQSSTLALYALIFVIVLQQVESNIVTPNVMSSQTEITQLLVIVAIVAGGVVGGILGMLAAIPLAAALNVLAKEVVAPLVRRWTGATPQGADAPSEVAALTNQTELN